MQGLIITEHFPGPNTSSTTGIWSCSTGCWYVLTLRGSEIKCLSYTSGMSRNINAAFPSLFPFVSLFDHRLSFHRSFSLSFCLPSEAHSAFLHHSLLFHVRSSPPSSPLPLCLVSYHSLCFLSFVVSPFFPILMFINSYFPSSVLLSVSYLCNLSSAEIHHLLIILTYLTNPFRSIHSQVFLN